MKHQHATVLPEAPNPVNERPENMPFYEYRALRKETNKIIKNRLQKGFLVFEAQRMILDEIGKPIGFAFRNKLGKPAGKTQVGSTKHLQLA